jgi:hypothetical protein
MDAVALRYPKSTYKPLDLPQVIASIPAKSKPSKNVELIGGNIFDPATIPECDVIVITHFLVRCMWTEQETTQILQTCHDVLSPTEGHVILAEAVIPDTGSRSSSSKASLMSVSLDALYMLVGRERQRTESEWRAVSHSAGFRVKGVITTNAPSCFLIALEKQE